MYKGKKSISLICLAVVVLAVCIIPFIKPVVSPHVIAAETGSEEDDFDVAQDHTEVANDLKGSSAGMEYSEEYLSEEEPEANLSGEQYLSGESYLAGETNFPAAEKPDISERDRGDIIIAVDAGHGGEDEGCSRQNVLEKDINLKIAEQVRAGLLTLGYQVLMVREGDSDVILDDRAVIANQAGADIYVSIHQNSCEEEVNAVSGVETWYNGAKAEDGSLRLAQLIHSEVVKYSKANDRSIIEDDELHVIRDTVMPSCLVETGFLSNPMERENLVDPVYQEKLAEAIVSGIDLYCYPKTMYLTFDDGPSREDTDKVLDILKANNIKATFFLIGEYVEKYPETAKRIADEGHTIGIHCYRHDYSALYQSTQSYLDDFEKARQAVYDATGVWANLYRFPGGSVNRFNKAVRDDILEKMGEQGYICYDWNASIEDAGKNNAPEVLLENAKSSILGRRKIVMLAHDRIDNTVLCLQDLIDQFPEYRMLPLTEDVTPIQF